MNKTMIIAEAGVNHNGQLELALALVEAAAKAGADAVKFQTFNAKQLVTAQAPQAKYQAENTQQNENQLAMLEKLQLSATDHQQLIAHCEKFGIKFMSTAFDSESLTFLASELRLPILKIPSGEITNAPLLLQFARTGADLILSTGVCTLTEIQQALAVLAFGLTQPDTEPDGVKAFQAAYLSAAGQQQLAAKVILLHCTTEYPAPLEDINLRAMATLRQHFNLRVGYSDHSAGILVPTAAVALEACVIEKHFTLDKSLPGPDHKASLEPAELCQMVEAIRNVELVLGHPQKTPAPSELHNRTLIRKSLVAAKPLVAGQILKPADLTAKRPATGRSPFDYWQLLGTAVNRDYQYDEPIDE